MFLKAAHQHLGRVFDSSLPINLRIESLMVKTRRASALASGHDEDKDSERQTKRVKLSNSALEGTSRDVNSNSFPGRRLTRWKVGAHVSAAGGIENAVINAAEIGANAFAIFLKSQRKWSSPDLTADSIASFKSRMQEYGYSSGVVLPHGSYLINLGNPDIEKRKKSYNCFLDDLKRCEQLGLELYNFHPGSTVGATTEANSISLIAECINRAHKETNSVTTVLENMAGAGNIIGCEFSHLANIIAQVEDKTRVGVCLDTCHMFAAGYDIRTKEAWNDTLERFNNQIGLSYLRVMHLNDSKAEFNSKRDRHENIGIGHIGLEAFHHILNDVRVQNIPLILETPSFELPKEVWGKEISVLHMLSGLDLEHDGKITELVEEIHSAVKEAEKTSGKGKGKIKSITHKGKKTGEEEKNDGRIH